MTLPLSVSLPQPDDWHLHLRDGAMMRAVLPATAAVFGRAIVMPNLKPPVIRTADAASYRERILKALPSGMDFKPLMTAYLTETTDPDDLERGFRDGILFAAKLYPAGATTNSDAGVRHMEAIAPLLERLQAIGMPLLCHTEVADPTVDFFDREKVFIDRVTAPLHRAYPQMKLVLEHLSTAYAADFVRSEGGKGTLAATLTAHHMALSRNALFDSGLHPHLFCLPVLKREEDRQAIVRAATSGEAMFFAGTDSAPHPRTAKEAARANGGIFTAPLAVAVYAELFERADALDKLPAFLSLNGPAFYGLPVNAKTLTLEKAPPAPEAYASVRTEDGDEVVPFPCDSLPLPGSLSWRVKSLA